MVGIALGVLNASSEMVVRQYFAFSDVLPDSDLDVMGLLSVEQLLHMRQLGDISQVLLVVGVAVMGSRTWKKRIGLFLWIFALATLIRIAVIRLHMNWPSHPGDMDLLWTVPTPLTLPVGLTIVVAVFSLILSVTVFKLLGGEPEK
ncbi:MAG: hypothetical protein JRG73_13740 [Deltaproteobacteria bacterium]|nr:hypothetical protein [Deltaproteobacteria bacterium]MBW2307983.1 hypothetical protein [Deltaproteobacteria bacterium]